MNSLDKQYLSLCQEILDKGTVKNTRNGTTRSVFSRQIRHSMKDGFPMITSKKLPFKTIVTELLWFLKGDTSLRYLLENNCNIWTGDFYSNYGKKMTDIMNVLVPAEFMDNGWVKFTTQERYDVLSKEEFIEKIKTDDNFNNRFGKGGAIYGKLWRDWFHGDWWMNGSRPMTTETHIDQIANLIHLLKTDPDNRRLLVMAWNPGELDSCILPPCHYSFQCYTRELKTQERMDWLNKKNSTDQRYRNVTLDELNVPKRAISLQFNMRSTDIGLGISFNLASYGILLELLAKECNMISDELIYCGGDVHIYENQISGIKEQLTRIPFETLPTLDLSNVKFPLLENIDNRTICPSDFVLKNYEAHPAIKMPLSN